MSRGGKSMSRLVKLGLVLAVAAGVMAPAAAQDYPTRNVKIVVPFGPGGPADVYARFLGQHLSESLKRSFVIENRPGAGAVIGTDEVVKAEPDGHTLVMMSNTHTVNETLLPNKPYQLMRDLVPVAPVNFSDLVMVINPSVAAKNLKEFIALAKSKPGALNYASSGPGTPYHLAGELFKYMSGTDIVHVPHRASGEARTSVIGGHTPLGVTGKKRSNILPDVPTVDEAGVPGYEATIWLGIMAPKGTPQPIVDKLNAEINKVLNRADVKEAWAKQGVEPLIMSPGEFDKYLRADIEKWAKVIKEAGIKVQ
jgi:tripartite-type tricarboxylate transporter receptor subunit TctC